jgi:hypothetical protein
MMSLLGDWHPASTEPKADVIYTVCFDCLPEHLVWWQKRLPRLQRITIWRNAKMFQSPGTPMIFTRGSLRPWEAEMRQLMTDKAAVCCLDTPTLSHIKVVPTADQWCQMRKNWDWLFLETLNLGYNEDEFSEAVASVMEDWADPVVRSHFQRKQLFSAYGASDPDRVL